MCWVQSSTGSLELMRNQALLWVSSIAKVRIQFLSCQLSTEEAPFIAGGGSFVSRERSGNSAVGRPAKRLVLGQYMERWETGMGVERK